MQQAAHKISSDQARKLYPLAKLSQDDTEELLRSSIVSRLSPGTPVFRANDLPKQVFYLLAGEVELNTKDKGRRLIKSGTTDARKPMGRGISGHLSAVARKDSLVVSFDADMLELFLSWTNPEAYLVSEMQTSRSSEWLDRLLQSRGLLRFSEEHIQTLLNRMCEVHLRAGDVVIEQEGKDDYYYIIKNGRCSVTRQPHPGAKVIKLAELRQGDAFGEEALLANTPRSANIVMEEDGDLMRLSREDFSKLLAEPLLSSVRWEDSHNLVKMGAVFLDIRLPDEFERDHLPGSINIPLALLRLRLKQLSHHRKYIICCNDGHRSAVAAFLLNRHGFDAFILEGGIEAIAAETEAATEERTAEPAAANTPVFSSLADYWGATVDEPARAAFADAPGMDTHNKTTPPPATTAPVSKGSPESRSSKRGQPAAPAPFDLELIMEEAREQRRSTLLVRSAIALSLLGAAAIIGLALLPGTPADIAPTTGTTAAQTSAIPSRVEGAAPKEQNTPWNNTPENELRAMVGGHR